MGNPIKIGFVGTGSIGQRHIRNLLAIEPDAQLVFMRENSRKDDLSEQVRACVVGNFDQVLGTGVDGVVISTPSALHAQTLIPTIEAGLPVYVEKPIVTSSADIERVLSALDKTPELPSLFGCNLRYLPSLCRMREIVANDIGQPVRASFEAGQWLPGWRPNQDYKQSYSASRQTGGGVIFDLIHELDAAEWICGPLDVAAATSAQVPSLDIDVDSVANILMTRHDRSLLVAVQLDYVARVPLRQYRVVGDRGTVTWNLAGRSLKLETTSGEYQIDSGVNGFDLACTYETAMTEFVEAVITGKMTSNQIQTGLRANVHALTARQLAC